MMVIVSVLVVQYILHHVVFKQIAFVVEVVVMEVEGLAEMMGLLEAQVGI